MDKQPEALRLAECLTDYTECTLAEMDQAAAELRRLHALNAELLEALEALRKTPYMPPALIGIFDDLIAKAKEQP